MDRAWRNAMAKCPRIVPADYLKAYSPLTGGIDPKVKGLRSTALKRERELVEACLFCHGLSCRMGEPVWVVDTPEDYDYDFVAVREISSDNYFTRIQLKEVVAEHRNQNASIQSTIDELVKKYPAPDLTVAVRVNQTTMLDLDEITIPPTLRIGALWVYGGALPDGSRWLIAGNLMEPEPNLAWLFDYPV
jgi:hypothetical protein